MSEPTPEEAQWDDPLLQALEQAEIETSRQRDFARVANERARLALDEVDRLRAQRLLVADELARWQSETVRLRATVAGVERVLELADLADPPYRNILHADQIRAALAGKQP